MSDRQLRKILADVIAEIDQGRLRPRPPRGLRGTMGATVLAAALGLGAMACDGRSVGSTADAGTLPDVTVVDAGSPPVDGAQPLPDAASPLDGGPVGAYGIPEVDAGATISLDGGNINLYMAISFDDAGVDAEVTPAEDADVSMPAYMAPPPPEPDEEAD